jgi:hypothetical protein
MKDYRIYGWSYKAAVERAQRAGMLPCTKPDERLVKRLQSTVEKVLGRIEQTAEEKEKLAGFFLYVADKQPRKSEQLSWGITLFDGNTAVIGLSVELLSLTRPIFWRYVLLHELAHVYSGKIIEHDEIFNEYLCGLSYNYFAGQPESRGDIADGKRLTDKHKEWRM